MIYFPKMHGDGRKETPGPTADSIRTQLDRVLASRTFARAQSLGRLLRYLVEQTLAGQADCLKEHTVAVEALGRGDSFDPDADPIVRVQARRLRQKLEEYYAGEGLPDAIVIEVPKGAYIPKFVERTMAPAARPASRRKVIAYAASALAGSAAGGWLLFQKPAAERDAGTYRSIAVLPFENLSNNPAQEYFADGLTEVLISALSKIASLRVLSRTSAMAYKHSSKKLVEIAREVNVDAVVEGSVTPSGDKVRVTVQLIDATTERHIWGETYERDLRDVLRLQSEIAQTIAAEIHVKLTPMESDRLASTRRVDPDVLRPYLEARYSASQLGAEALQKSIALYQQAIDRDPGFAPAYAGMAFSNIFLCGRQMAPRQGMPKAKAAALRALQLDESLAEGYAALGWVSLQYDWDWSAAEWSISQAIRLDPSSASAHQLRAHYLTMRSEHGKAIAEALRAQELDPLSLFTQSYVQLTYFAARDFKRAAEFGRSLLERDKNFAQGHLLTALALAKLGMRREAMEHFRTVARLDENGYLAMGLAHGYALFGSREEASRILEKMSALSGNRYICSYEVAATYAALGETDRAFDWFHKAVQDRSECLVWAKVSPWLDPVRADPRFDKLLREVGFEI